jgi:hypothetical protein
MQFYAKYSKLFRNSSNISSSVVIVWLSQLQNLMTLLLWIVEFCTNSTRLPGFVFLCWKTFLSILCEIHNIHFFFLNSISIITGIKRHLIIYSTPSVWLHFYPLLHYICFNNIKTAAIELCHLIVLLFA